MQTPIELIGDAESDLQDWQALLDGFTEPRSKAAALPPPRSGQLSPRVPALQQVSSIGMPPHPQPSDLVVHAGIPRVGSWSSSLTPPTAPGPHPRFERSCTPLQQPCIEVHKSESLCRSDHFLDRMRSTKTVPDSRPLLESHSAPVLDKGLRLPAKRSTETPTQQVLRARHSSASPLLLAKWMQLLAGVQSVSNLWISISTSPNRDLHAARILDGIAPSTALKYISSCVTFLKTLHSLRVSFDDLTDTVLADVLITMSLAKSSSCAGGSCASTIKALKWLFRVADIPALSAVQSALIHSFLTSRIPKDRREAPPLPLWVLAQWERRVLMSSCPTHEVIILGAFLIMAWASLRFSDAQRMDIDKVVLSDTNLRGVVWRSKTSAVGVPFGILSAGFLSHGAHNWVWKFLSTLDTFYHNNQVQVQAIDFLLPDCTLDQICLPIEPMTYATALLHCPWRSGPSPLHGLDLNFSIHSLKATFLSWGPQLHEHTTPEQRLLQGHHASQSSSLAVYSRDSVWGALAFQTQVLLRVQSGWRPQIAQHRGSQQPLKEPPVLLERFSKPLPVYEFRWFSLTTSPALDTPDETPIAEGSCESSSSSSDSDSSVSATRPVAPKPLKVVPETLLIGQYRYVAHAMIPADPADTWRPCRHGIFLKPACGRPMKASLGKVVEEISPDMQLCQHAACRRLWAHFQISVA